MEITKIIPITINVRVSFDDSFNREESITNELQEMVEDFGRHATRYSDYYFDVLRTQKEVQSFIVGEKCYIKEPYSMDSYKSFKNKIVTIMAVPETPDGKYKVSFDELWQGWYSDWQLGKL